MTVFDKDTFAARMRGKRAELNLSREALAKISGVPKCSIDRYEQGVVTPSLEAASKIAVALQTSLDYLTNLPAPDAR